MLHLAGQYFLNHLLREDELREQVRQLAEAGYECVYAHARAGLRTPYFSRSWWEAMDVIVEECRKNQIKFGIWDEDYYPSPVAGNRIIWEHPELLAQHLEFTVFEAAAHSQVERSFDAEATIYRCFALFKTTGELQDITEYCGTVATQWLGRGVNSGAYSPVAKIGAPHWRTSMNRRRFGLLWTPPADCTVIAVQVSRSVERHNTDILNPETARLFLEYTHQQYYRRYGEQTFREVFASTFMDEPAPTGDFPWTGRFAEEFLADHGYELPPLLPHLIQEINAQSFLIRHHYRQTQMRLQCKNYLDKVRQWDAEHGLQSSGHLTRTEWLSLTALRWPNELRCCKYLDLPCTDPLGFHTAWRDTAAYHTGIKVVTSAAHLFDKPQAGSDALAVTGNATCLRDLKFQLDYQMVLGITHFNVHGLSYSFDGPRKDETPPSLFYQHSEWPQMRTLLDHVRNTSAVLASGKPLIQLAVLYPAAGFYCKIQAVEASPEAALHQLSETLLSHQKDFDFIDEVTLGEMTDGDLSGFIARYPFFLVAEAQFMEAATARRLERYAQAGGKLYLLGPVPQLLGTPEAPLSNWSSGEQFRSADWLTELPGPRLTGNGREDIFIQRREIDGQVIAFLFNRAERAFEGELDGIPVWVAPGSSLLLRPGETASAPLTSAHDPQTLSGQWEVSFKPNQVPLNYWTVHSTTQSSTLDLLQRETVSTPTGVDELTYQTRFLYSGEPRSLRLVLEESTFEGNWQCWVNDQEITGFKPEPVYDCRNLTADLTAVLRTGSTPTLNHVKLIVRGPNPKLKEMPYLYGEFQAEFRHAHYSLPYLTSHSPAWAVEHPTDWRQWGFGHYSGSADYDCELLIRETGNYRLDAGIVEDCIEIRLDDQPIATLPWPPYVIDLRDLTAGTHRLRLRVSNGPGNRDRLAGLPAGLLGPVRLFQV